MFELAVMPLTLIWQHQGGQASLDAARIFLIELQSELSKLSGSDVAWAEPEEAEIEDFEEPVLLDPFCLYALRAVAAWLEFHGDLEGFELDETPWEHAVFNELEEQNGSRVYPHLLHTDAELIAFIPSELSEVFLLADEDVEDEEAEADDFAVASLPKLREELDAIAGLLEMDAYRDHLASLLGEGDREEPEEVKVEIDLEDPEDALLPARFAWMMLDMQLNKALEAGLPMLVFYNDFDEDLSDFEEEEQVIN